MKKWLVALCVLVSATSCAPELSSCPAGGYDRKMDSAPLWARKHLVKKMTTNHKEGHLVRR